MRKTLAYGNKYGLGFFFLFEEGERQIGWIPERDQIVFQRVEKLLAQDGFQANIVNSSRKFINEKFSKITISIVCAV